MKDKNCSVHFKFELLGEENAISFWGFSKWWNEKEKMLSSDSNHRALHVSLFWMKLFELFGKDIAQKTFFTTNKTRLRVVSCVSTIIRLCCPNHYIGIMRWSKWNCGFWRISKCSNFKWKKSLKVFKFNRTAFHI